MTAHWLAEVAQANEALKSISEEQKPVTNTVKKTFKLHPDQKEILEAALEDAKQRSGTKFDTVALEYVCYGYMGTSPLATKPRKPLSRPRGDHGK